MDLGSDEDRSLAGMLSGTKIPTGPPTRKGSRTGSPRQRRRRSKSKSKTKRRGGRRSKSKGRRRRSSRRSSRRSRTGSRRGKRRGSVRKVSKAGMTSSESGTNSPEGAISPVPVLGEGESSLISSHVTELEITLYRPLPEDGKPLLFFDTTACLFREHGRQIDYVGVGRRMTNDKGLLHRAHDVVSVDTACKVSDNFLEPAGGPKVVAGDTVVANLKKVSMCAGFSLCSTLFTKEVPLCEATGVYYAVKKANERLPLAIVPVQVTTVGHNSCIVLMVRKRKNCSESAWELVRLGETLVQQDVKGVVKALQSRGLVDPANYTFDFLRFLSHSTADHDSESMDSFDDYIDDADHLREKSPTPFTDSLAPDDLLRNIPRVKREGRRQYSVGRSAVNLFVAEGDSSDDDEVTEDALRAVVPKYTDTLPVRYDDKTYNIGSCSDRLTHHYVDRREEYGLISADALGNGSTNLPPIVNPTSLDLRRFSFGTMGFLRPPIPPELSSTFPHMGRRRPTLCSRGTRLGSPSRKKRRKGKPRRKRKSRSRSRSHSRRKWRSSSRKSSCKSRRGTEKQ